MTSLKKTTLILSYFFLSACVNSQIPGCTDILATNYDNSATENNGSCIYPSTTILPDSTVLLPGIMHGTSGLLNYGDKVMTHNDHIDSNLYIFSPFLPNNYESYNVKGIIPQDWEEIAEDETYYYLGDFGNNSSGNRTNLKIYRIKKSELKNNPEPEIITFSYNNQTDFTPVSGNSTDFDCEAFIVTDTKIYLFTKEWNQLGTAVYELDKNPGTHIATFKTHYDVEGLITGATHITEKNLVVLSGYSLTLKPFVYLLYDFDSDNFFNGNKRKIILDLPFHQVEGITTKNGLDYFITNEKFTLGNSNVEPKIHSLNLSSYLNNFLQGELSLEKETSSFSEVKIYPNPATNYMLVNLPTILLDKIHQIKIIDALGKEIFDQQKIESEIKLNFSAYHQKGNFQIVFLNKIGQTLFKKSFVIQ